MTARTVRPPAGREPEAATTAVRQPSVLAELLPRVPLPVALVAVVVVAGVATATSPLRGLQVAVVVGAVLWGLHRPAQLVLLAVAVVPVTAGLQRGLPFAGLRLSEVVVCAVAVVVLPATAARRSRRFDLLDVTALGYVVVNVVAGGTAVVLHPQPVGGDAVGVLLGPVPYFLLYATVRSVVTDAATVRAALRLLLLGAYPVCLVAVLQFFDVGPVRAAVVALTGSPSAPLPGESGVVRATGVFSHWHELGGYLLMLVLLALTLLLRPGQRVLPRRALLGVLALAGVSLLMTTTLVVIGGTVAGVLWLAHRHGVLRRAAGLLALAALAGGVVLGSNLVSRLGRQFGDRQPLYEIAQTSVPLLPQTISYRLQVWTEQYLPEVLRSPLVGWGPQLPAAISWRYTESVYLTLLMRGGVLLLLAYAAFVVATWVVARRTPVDAAPEQRAVATVVATTAVLFAVMQTINPYFTSVGYPHVLWALLGTLPAVPRFTDVLRPSVASTVTGTSVSTRTRRPAAQEAP